MSSLSGRYFRLGDELPHDTRMELQELGYMRKYVGKPPTTKVRCGCWVLKDGLSVMARYAGEKRPPKKGEWYLSGAVVTAYRAPNDLSTEYHIAKLVVVETKTTTRRKELQAL